MTQSLDQMRRLEPLNVKNPPLQQKLNLHCKKQSGRLAVPDR